MAGRLMDAKSYEQLTTSHVFFFAFIYWATIDDEFGVGHIWCSSLIASMGRVCTVHCARNGNFSHRTRIQKGKLPPE